MNKELELEAEKLYKTRVQLDTQSKTHSVEQVALYEKQAFIAGATSKYVEKQKLEFAIEQLNKLDFSLKEKYTDLTYLQKEFVGKMREQHIRNKKSGISVAKEEIRRDIKELEQKLSEL